MGGWDDLKGTYMIPWRCGRGIMEATAGVVMQREDETEELDLEEQRER